MSCVVLIAYDTREDFPPLPQLSGIIVATTAPANTSKAGLAYHSTTGDREGARF